MSTRSRKDRRGHPRISKARLDLLVEEAIVDCRRARVRQTVPIIDLPLPAPSPAGAEWIDAYRHWLRGR